jgi:hypothetical protein
MIQKQFTVNIPDELYVNKYSLEKVFQDEYMGPETIIIEVLPDGSILGVLSDDDVKLDTNSLIVELDSEIYPAIAYWVSTRDKEHFYFYDEEVNHDGTIYTYPSNPRLHDYYDLIYLPDIDSESISLDTLTQGQWRFVLITRDKETQGEIQTRRNIEYVKSGLALVELDEEYQVLYDKFMSDAEAYLEVMSTVYPWKYVEITTPVMPKIPLKLIRLINELKKTE